MDIAIIGAGAAGLAAARHALATDGVRQVTVFEQSDRLGGTWAYTDRVGDDEFGLPIGSSMYHDLVTNLPKEIICYPDVPYDPALKCYLKSSDVLAYLEHFAEHFDLVAHIQFRHQVLHVRPIVDSTRWSVTVRNVRSATDSTVEFDSVMVCNGHHSVPAYPDELPGRDVFAGQQMHSHDYRRAEAFAGKSVLVIGSGPSGMDIACNIRKHTAKVCISTRGEATAKIVVALGKSMVRPDVVALTESGVRFDDGTDEAFDTVIYCTGYLYRMPFLDAECGVTIEDNHVRPLFKQCVHIEHPTLFLLGLTTFDLPFLVIDTQARFCLALLTGKWRLPERPEMQRIAEQDLQRCWDKGYSKRQAHKVFDFISEYVSDMIELAHLDPLPPVIFKMFNHVIGSMMVKFERFRTEQFTVVDNDNFTHYFLEDAV